jgi:hypothetical protein
MTNLAYSRYNSATPATPDALTLAFVGRDGNVATYEEVSTTKPPAARVRCTVSTVTGKTVNKIKVKFEIPLVKTDLWDENVAVGANLGFATHTIESLVPRTAEGGFSQSTFTYSNLVLSGMVTANNAVKDIITQFQTPSS